MSTRATVYIHGGDGCLDIKLYHHRDGYVEYLGTMLENALEKRRKGKLKDEYGSKSKNLIECIANIGGFEPAFPIHGDAEYVYHIEYSYESKRNNEKNKLERTINYKLECQSGCYGEDVLLQRPKVLLAERNGKKRKKLDWKQAEKELGNTTKFIDGYLD